LPTTAHGTTWWQGKGGLYTQERRPVGREGSIREIESDVLRGIVKVNVSRRRRCRDYLRDESTDLYEYLLLVVDPSPIILPFARIADCCIAQFTENT